MKVFIILLIITANMALETLGAVLPDEDCDVMKINGKCNKIKKTNTKDKRTKEEKFQDILEKSIDVKSSPEMLEKFCENNPTLKSCILACNKESVESIVAEEEVKTCNGFTNLTDVITDPEGTERRDEEKSRKKRSTTADPCTNGVHAQTVLTFVLDDNGNQVEVYQSPSDYIYQTFHILHCNTNSNYMPPTGYVCKISEVKLQAAVFPDPYTNNIEERTVVMPGGCSLRKIIS